MKRALLMVAVVSVACAAAPADPDDVVVQVAPVAFVVGPVPGAPDHGDAFTLVLGDPADIAAARSIVADPLGTTTRIVAASIAAGGDGVNRNHAAPGAPPWSWRLTGFDGFVEITAEVLDGWPAFVESDVQGWIDNTHGRIGFWNYTVRAELASVPVAPCGPADIGAAGGMPGPWGGDSVLDNNDFVVFIDWFFASDARADRGATGGVAESDGAFDNNDFVVFVDQFFGGC
ncbi:MAG TPA: GC-type dockerin domain-anchored protein [Phycisphaerales bacterium]|nr:GC-type dockerin domain-anchored protein [Phycisphaerales bacterium]